MVGRHGEPEFYAFIEKRCQEKKIRPHNNTVALHIVVNQSQIS